MRTRPPAQQQASALVSRAMVDWESGRRSRAVATFKDAMTLAQHLGTRLHLATAHRELGRLSVTGTAEERIAGRAYLEEAQRLYRDFGYQGQVA